jgi:thiol-disulfide isomerase/thioredoxin
MRKILLFSFLLLSVEILHGELPLKTAPNFAITRTDDERVVLYQALETLKEGELLVINFTGTTCKPCKVEIPRMMEFRKNLDLKSSKLHLWVVFVGDDKDKVTETGKSLGITKDIAIFYDPLGASYNRFQFEGVPATFVIDRSGAIVYNEIGYNEDKFSRLTTFIKNNLK